MLLQMQKAGEISTIECQVTTRLTAGITHKTDFKVYDLRLNEPVWVEYKGIEDQRWRDIKKLWRVYGPGRLRIYKGSGLRIKLVEEVIPDPALQF